MFNSQERIILCLNSDEILYVIIDEDVTVLVVGRRGEHLVFVVQGVVGLLKGVDAVRQLFDQLALPLLFPEDLGMAQAGGQEKDCGQEEQGETFHKKSECELQVESQGG